MSARRGATVGAFHLLEAISSCQVTSWIHREERTMEGFEVEGYVQIMMATGLFVTALLELCL
jgi:hypothetical protein